MTIMKAITASMVFVALSANANITNHLTLTTSSQVLVLPNNLVNNSDYVSTCVGDGVRAPRVRLRASLKWTGKGNLVPLAFQLKFNDSRLVSGYSTMLSASGEYESLAYLFGVGTDYIPPGSGTYTTQTCFLDYGNFPYPISPLSGSQEIRIPARIKLIGVIRDRNKEKPFEKSIFTEVIYVTGSVPYN